MFTAISARLTFLACICCSLWKGSKYHLHDPGPQLSWKCPLYACLTLSSTSLLIQSAAIIKIIGPGTPLLHYWAHFERFRQFPTVDDLTRREFVKVLDQLNKLLNGVVHKLPDGVPINTIQEIFEINVHVLWPLSFTPTWWLCRYCGLLYNLYIYISFLLVRFSMLRDVHVKS